MTAPLDAEWEQILAPAIASLESTRPNHEKGKRP